MTDLHKFQAEILECAEMYKAHIRCEYAMFRLLEEFQKASDNFKLACEQRDIRRRDSNRKQLTDYMEEAINERSK